MEKTQSPFEQHLGEDLESHGYQIAGLIGRKLFESGHFEYAVLSSIKGASVEVARGLVKPEDISQQFSFEFWSGLRALQCLIYTTELCGKLTSDFNDLLASIATKDMNRIRTRPTFSEIGLRTKQMLSSELGCLKWNHTECSNELEKIHSHWQKNLEDWLAKSQVAPSSVTQLLPKDFGRLALGISSYLKIHLEILTRWQSHLFTSLIEAHQPFRFTGTRSHFLQGVKDQVALRVHSILSFKGAHEVPFRLESTIEKTCFTSLSSLYDGFKLVHLAREDLAQFAEQPSQALLNENFYYAESLEKQLCQMGTPTQNAKELKSRLFSYCEQHATRASEILDDEIQKLCPNISKEAIATARLQTRLEDDSFPLSVKFKETVEKAFRG